MERTDPITRRRALRLVGGATGVGLVAGCLADGEDPEEEESDAIDEDDDESEKSDDTDNEGAERSDDGNESDETDNEEAERSDDGNESDETDEDATENLDTDSEEWKDVDEIVLSATTAGWEGVEPEVIAGEENPTLVLTEGAEYVLTWKNADGVPHNVELWDEHGEVVGEYETELLAEEGESQSLEFEATAELAEYVCELHDDWGKRGDLELDADG